MKIKSIEIKNITGSTLKGNCENIRHIKTLPCLSIVQSVHGYYEISLNGHPPCVTEEGSAFVAPAGAVQNILHHNASDGYMQAQWVFMNIVVNDVFDFDDVFDLPILLPSKHEKQLSENIFIARTEENICKKYEAAYRLTDILIEHSVMKHTVFDDSVIRLKKYINDHYSEKLTKEALANIAVCSVPNLYRLFQKHFNLSPHNYVNKIRLEKASVILECSNSSVSNIAEAVGFDDPIYFSRLFKEHYGLSPKNYRETLSSLNGQQKR